MNIIDEVTKLFGSEPLSIEVDDRATTFRLNAKLSERPNLSDIAIRSFLQYIPIQDILKLSLLIDEQDPIVLISNSYDISFLDISREYFEHYELNEEIYLKIEIEKKVSNNFLNIYSWNSFNSFVQSLPPLQFLDVLSEAVQSRQCLNFKFLENSLLSFETKWVRFGYDFEQCEFQSHLHHVEANCYFNDIKRYPYTPEHFKLIKRPTNNNAVTEFLDKLAIAFSVISIFDHSRIENSSVKYKLNGYKLIQGEFILNSELLTKSENYLELYDWIYSSEGNIADKLGVARNIISLYIEPNNISTDNGLIHSIKSAHQTYLKDNVASYLSLRSNILDELGWISQKFSEVIKNYLSAYKQSSLTFISFFVSIFLLRTLNAGKFLKVFNNEVSVIAISFLLLSILFLIFSRHTVVTERNRLVRKYSNLKTRYTDLLIEEDINRVLKNDSEFNYEIEYINGRIRQYSWLWIFTIVILLCAILLVSELVTCSFYYTKEL